MLKKNLLNFAKHEKQKKREGGKEGKRLIEGTVHCLIIFFSERLEYPSSEHITTCFEPG